MSELQVNASTSQPPPQAPADVPFRCPTCAGVLRMAGETMTCTSCAAVFPRRDGIYDFRCRRHDYYFNPVPRAEMADLVREAAHTPWDDTVRRFLRHTRNASSWIDNIAVNGRYTWKLFLELSPDARFLDFGCGLGNMTQNIAPHVGEVVALDLTWERLLFAQQRFAKFNADSRITLVAGGDGRYLPFPDGHFDCIALSGVLEWIADDSGSYDGGGTRAAKALRMLMSFFGETNPRRTQLRFLQELGRILKPDGQLFVAIENRWNYEYFGGRPDHHSGLKYGSLLPRFLANLYSIARSRRPYRTYTYSFPQFRRLFTDAGFPHQECLGLTPGYSGLRRIVPAHLHSPRWKPQPEPTLSMRIKRSRYFVPAFGMASRKTADRPASLLCRLLRKIETDVPSLGSIELSECLVTGKDKVVVIGSAQGRSVILKLPASPLAEAGEACHHRMISTLRAFAPLTSLVPQALTSGTYQGVRYYVETAVRGQPLGNSLDMVSRGAAASIVGRLLLTMKAPNETQLQIRAGDAAYVHLLGDAVANLRKVGIDPAQCDALESRLGKTLLARAWPLGLQHGDFTGNNILVLGSDLTGVIDWEYANLHGLPLLDALGYVESMQRLVDPRSTMQQNIDRLARWDWPCEEERSMLRTMYRHFGVDESMHEFLCQLSWLSHLSHQLDTTARLDQKFIDRRLGPMLDALAGTN